MISYLIDMGYERKIEVKGVSWIMTEQAGRKISTFHELRKTGNRAGSGNAQEIENSTEIIRKFILKIPVALS